MNFDIYNIPITENKWFSSKFEYNGWGRAEFDNPKVSVEGLANVIYNDFGAENITLKVKNFEGGKSSHPFELLKLLDGNLKNGNLSNKCNYLTIDCENGKLVSKNNRISGVEISEKTILKFTTLSHIFRTKKRKPIYWVLPLVNFISNFSDRNLQFDQHPLRIYPVPKIPKGLSESDSKVAFINANRKNKLIVFKVNNCKVFIEPLSDYDKRETLLKTNQKNI